MTGDSSDDEAHLAALLAVLAVTQPGAGPNGTAEHGTPLQQWRARRLAALAGEGGISFDSSALPRRPGQRR